LPAKLPNLAKTLTLVSQPPAIEPPVAPAASLSFTNPKTAPEVAAASLVATAPLNVAAPLKEPSVQITIDSLLHEVKKAYALILQEKEEQIFLLKQQASDLKTLVRVLEEQNDNMKLTGPKFDLDLEL
jgi:hypothetical protein